MAGRLRTGKGLRCQGQLAPQEESCGSRRVRASPTAAHQAAGGVLFNIYGSIFAF